MSVRKLYAFLALSVFVFGAGAVSAKTPDGQTPAVETVCDNETGAAFGLCNAYCEAHDCTDPNQRSSDNSCNQLRENFMKHTGRLPPCEITCPCPALVTLFADIESGSVAVEQCIIYPTFIFVSVQGDGFVTINDGEPATCSANDGPPFVELNPTERLVCRVKLRQAVESRGVPCRPPE